MSRISSRLRWMAGTRMCDGLSSPSCTINSARSVSRAEMPASASASLSPISCVAIDLTLITSVSPVARTRSVTMRLASAASRAQCTWPPRAVTAASNCSSSSGSRAMTSRLIADPASRSCSQSGFSPTTWARLARMVWVALRRLERSWPLRNSWWAAAVKPSSPRRWPTPAGARGGVGRPRFTGLIGFPRSALRRPALRRPAVRPVRPRTGGGGWTPGSRRCAVPERGRRA